MATLGGSTFVYNGNKQDYHYLLTLQCLYDLCDEVAVCCGGDDGTVYEIRQWAIGKKNVHVIPFSKEAWDAQVGREKLSYFSNIAIAHLTTNYNIYIQCDEILHESCYPKVREAIQTGAEAFIVTRYNLWATPLTMLNVSQDRKPCSTEIFRLAKTKYRCVDDAESLQVPSCVMDYLHDIRIYHTGFVRDKEKHLEKIRHMQEKVFLWDVDKRIHDNTDGFDPWKWGFSPSDVTPITEPLPLLIKDWCMTRYQDPFRYSTEGYNLAKQWIEMFKSSVNPDIEPKWFTDGWSVVQYANDLWKILSSIYQSSSPQ